ncbi:hypothetical protein V5F77_10960 [Xanthobacter sp. DSM 24535]
MDAIDDVRFARRFNTRTACIRALIAAGIASFEQRSTISVGS